MQNELKNRYLLDLIQQGEHTRQDFKYEISDSKKIARTLSAFANTEGGRLLIGVKDNGRIRGVSSDEEYHMIEAASQMYTQPVVPFTTERHEHRKLTVLEITVSKGEDRPYTAPDPQGRMRAYVRVNDQNFVADTVQYLVWKNDKQLHSVQIKYSRSERFLLNYLSENKHITLKKYIRYAGIKRQEAIKILSDMLSLNLIKIIHTKKESLFVSANPKND